MVKIEPLDPKNHPIEKENHLNQTSIFRVQHKKMSRVHAAMQI